MFRLTYDDKYQLYSDLVRGNADRLFIETDERPELGSSIMMEIRVGKSPLPIPVDAVVVGRRSASKRFPDGMYVQIAASSLEKCRRFLGLEQVGTSFARARRTARTHCELSMQFTSPRGEGLVRNLSTGGAFISTTAKIKPGERVELRLPVSDPPLELRADAQWVAPNGDAVGVRFVDVTEKQFERIEEFVSRSKLRQHEGIEREPKPILVADDEPAIVDVLRQGLTRHGFEVFEASTGTDTLEMVRQLQPRAVILDILLPGMDGVDVCKTMRGDAELTDIPVIFLSALPEETLHDFADESGATDYLTKPVRMTDLLNMIGQYLAEPGSSE